MLKQDLINLIDWSETGPAHVTTSYRGFSVVVRKQLNGKYCVFVFRHTMGGSPEEISRNIASFDQAVDIASERVR